MSDSNSWITPGTVTTGIVAVCAAGWALLRQWFNLVRRDELATAVEEAAEKLDKRFDRIDTNIETSRVEGENSRRLVYARLGALETNVAVIQERLAARPKRR